VYGEGGCDVAAVDTECYVLRKSKLIFKRILSSTTASNLVRISGCCGWGYVISDQLFYDSSAF
jgi:hypothetical protein